MSCEESVCSVSCQRTRMRERGTITQSANPTGPSRTPQNYLRIIGLEWWPGQAGQERTLPPQTIGNNVILHHYPSTAPVPTRNRGEGTLNREVYPTPNTTGSFPDSVLEKSLLSGVTCHHIKDG